METPAMQPGAGTAFAGLAMRTVTASADRPCQREMLAIMEGCDPSC